MMKNIRKKLTYNIGIIIRIVSFLKDYKYLSIFVIFISFLLSLSSAIRPYLTKEAIDLFILKGDQEGLLNIIIVIGLFILIEVVFYFLFIYISNSIANNVINDIRQKLLKNMIKFEISYFDKTKLGRIITRIINDTESVTNVFSQGLLSVFGDLLKILLIIIIMMYMNLYLSSIVIVCLLFLVAIIRWFQKAIKKTYKEVRDQVSNLNSFVQERISGIKVVKVFNREKQELEKFTEINKKHFKAHVKTVWYFSIFFAVIDVFSSLIVGIIVWIGGMGIISQYDITLGQLVAYIFFIQLLFRPLRQIADKFNVIQMGIVSLERVIVLMNRQTPTNKGKIELDNLKGDIIFNNVSFSYNKKENIIDYLSFSVKAGQNVAIVGPTGSGKTTIINLLANFYTLDKGNIYVDGHDISKLSNIYKHISVVMQDIFLFSDSIYNNIRLENKDINKKDVIDAAIKIGIHDFIMKLPNDYDFDVKEGGAMLSHGQRQLISFLRAYVMNPSILILDEATSSIDSETEKLIKKATLEITKNRTSIIIAHRLSTIKKADNIIFLDKGKIIEQGTHKDLLKFNGRYNELYQTQFN